MNKENYLILDCLVPTGLPAGSRLDMADLLQ